MIRTHGEKPYKAAIVHGGPGARGSVKALAKELSKDHGVLEPFQTKYTMGELINELKDQIQQHTDKPLTLIGHSWGAWLSFLFAAEYPQLVKQLVLVSSAPLQEEYVPLIEKNRRKAVSAEQREVYDNAMAILRNEKSGDKDAAMQATAYFLHKSDNYDAVNEAEDEIMLDNKMLYTVLVEASEMRRRNALYRKLKDIKCPVHVIHGDSDPHPFEGVINPLEEQGVDFKGYFLRRCGHTPFKERHAKEEFYNIMRTII